MLEIILEFLFIDEAYIMHSPNVCGFVIGREAKENTGIFMTAKWSLEFFR